MQHVRRGADIPLQGADKTGLSQFGTTARLNKAPGNIAASIRAAVSFGRDYPVTTNARQNLLGYARQVKLYKERRLK